MADQALTVGGAGTGATAPLGYTVPGAAEIILKGAFARLDGTSAAVAWLPCLRVKTPNGQTMLECVGSQVAAGASADMTWFPGVRGGGGSGTGVDTTDGSTAVNPTTELFIGSGLVLTNPLVGEAAVKVANPPNAGGVTLLYDFTVTAVGGQASIDTDVDGPDAGLFRTDLNYLEVFLSGRTTGATKIDDVSFQFNNDTGSNYTRAFMASSIAGSVGQGHSVGGSAILGVLPGANAAASVAGLDRLFIPNYANTTFYKTCEFTAWGSDTTTTGNTPTTFPYQIGVETALWSSTAALTRIKVFCTGDIDPAGNLDVGTRLSIWGR